MIRALLFACVLLLSACASQTPLPKAMPVSYTHLTLPTIYSV